MIWKSSRESLKESLISCSHRSDVADDQAQSLTVRATELWCQFKVQSPRDKGLLLPYPIDGIRLPLNEISNECSWVSVSQRSSYSHLM